VRPLVDWSFKLIAWLGICASLLVAARSTGNALIWTVTVLAYGLVLLFMVSFSDWLLHLNWLRRKKRPVSKIGRVAVLSLWWMISMFVAYGMVRAVDASVDAFVNARLLQAK
jgi:hypothetical protein